MYNTIPAHLQIMSEADVRDMEYLRYSYHPVLIAIAQLDLDALEAAASREWLESLEPLPTDEDAFPF